MAVAPLSLRAEDPGLSGVLGMAKVAASGTHLAEARSQSAQGFRVFSFSVRILIFFIIYFLVGVLIPLNFSLNELYPLSSVLCLSRKLDKLFEGRFLSGGNHPDLQEYLSRDDFFRWDSS